MFYAESGHKQIDKCWIKESGWNYGQYLRQILQKSDPTTTSFRFLKSHVDGLCTPQYSINRVELGQNQQDFGG